MLRTEIVKAWAAPRVVAVAPIACINATDDPANTPSSPLSDPNVVVARRVAGSTPEE